MDNLLTRTPKQKTVATVRQLDDRLVALALFIAALLPRLLALNQFITGDEPRWVIRSMSFLTGLLTADWQLTLQTGHPGVTTMWTGSLGLALDYLINHRSDGPLLAFVQNLPQDWEHIDPTILPWMRLPTVLLSAASVAILFWLLRSLGRTVAITAALLLAFHPWHLALSQLLHHDALVTIFATISVLLLLVVLHRWSWRWLALSGAMAGLAILSKSTAYALLPFACLTVLIEIFTRRLTWQRALQAGLLWSAAALVTILLLWPALWVAPGQVWQTVFTWAVESAEPGDVSSTLIPNFDQRFPDLGLLFYPVNWLLKTTPLMLLGFVFLPGWWRSAAGSARWWARHMLLWVGLFTLMLTLGDKRDGRYLLPIYFALCVLAACGLEALRNKLQKTQYFHVAGFRVGVYQMGFAVLLLGCSVVYYPYYLSYYNPLIGGPWLAPHLIKVGLGEGMDQAAAWLNVQPNAEQLKVAVELEQTFAPLFKGQATSHNKDAPFAADYVLTYQRQIQNGIPFPEYWQYYRARPPAYHYTFAGVDFVWLHHQPPLASVGRISFSDDLVLRAYTMDQPLASPNRPLTVTLIWRTEHSGQELVRLQLRDDQGQVWAESDPAPVLDPAGPSPIEGHYVLQPPSNLPRGTYHLWGGPVSPEMWREIASIPSGQQLTPADVPHPLTANFYNHIALQGFDLNSRALRPGDTLVLTLYWQALQPIPFPLTTSVQLLDPAGNLVAERDLQRGDGTLPTFAWHTGEWITDQITLPLPDTVPPDNYQLRVGWYHAPTGQRLPVVDHRRPQDFVTIESITIH